MRKSSLTCCIIAGLLITACDETKQPLAPEMRPTLESGSEVVVIEEPVPDSVKNAIQVPPSLSPGISANIVVAPGAAFTSVGGTTYSVTSVPFAPEPAPAAPPVGVNGPQCDDCVHANIPIGFAFTFYGTPHTTLTISSNGFLQFGPSGNHGCCSGGSIPSPDFLNNIIAVSWTDWVPGALGALRYERRGTAPNRKFIVQWTNVPEFAGTGRLTAQIVLSEGSNDITMYTTQQTIQLFGHESTQGIENAAGREAAFVAGRVRSLASRFNDAIRFTTQSNTVPSITAPIDLAFDNDAGVCQAAVAALGTPTVTDDAPGYSVGAPVRSDGAAIGAPFPVGTTTVTWTVTDAGGLTDSDEQTVTVSDVEAPTVSAPADVTVSTDPGQPYATVDLPAGTAADNCAGVSVTDPPSGTYPIGTTTVTYVATDAAGNAVSADIDVTVLDEENPSLSVSANRTVDATMPTGAAVTFSNVATDNSGSVTLSCSHASGSTFAIGTTIVTCTATDNSGNSVNGSFTVTVVGARAQIEDLIAQVTSLSLHNGTSQPLLSMLATALRDPGATAPEVACIKLDDFIIKLQDHKSIASIPQVTIDEMIADSQRIQNVLGCP